MVGNVLKGRTLYIPRMDHAGAACLAAVFRSVGIEATLAPPSDARTLELAGRHASGEECLPARLCVGDFLKVVESPHVDPRRAAFLMATTDGPCRFGQYVPHLRKILRELGYGEVPIISPTSADGYTGIEEEAPGFTRVAWQGVVAADILRRLLLRRRPYEIHRGDTDQTFEVSLQEVCQVLERPGVAPRERRAILVDLLTNVRERFRRIPSRPDPDRLLIGVVGEIYCRLNDFSNDHLVRQVEEQGGEVWLSDVAEWVWYCNDWEERMLCLQGRRLSFRMLGTKLRTTVQHSDERALLRPFQEDFCGREEPEHIRELLERALPYLPHWGAPGEMVLSVGKAVYLFERGADGVIDISPFTCMNGIVAEAIYPRLSGEHGGIPIRNFYFDGGIRDLEHDVGVFMELAQNYRRVEGSSRGCARGA